MQNHRSLRVYVAAQQLARQVHEVARRLPAEERFALADQLRRGALSIGSNIAEGCGRATQRDFCCFLDRALGSAREVEFQLRHIEASRMLEISELRESLTTVICVQKMLTRLIVKVRVSLQEKVDAH